ncbi:MAG TPA: hypothetical protein VGK74_18155 [Symbiobacteriaceae bacterium]|jgi:hypothetical protein
MFHLLAEGKSIFYNAAALFGYPVTGPAALFSMGTIQILQFIALGIGGAVFTAYKIAGKGKPRAFWPHVAVLAVFSIVNLDLFTLPMQHRV